MPASTATPNTLNLNAATDEVAQRLRHLPGLIWLDTAGHPTSADSPGGLSILTAAPTHTLTGHLSHPAPLQHALAELQTHPGALADRGFPLSGLFGSVDYDGTYHFGLYPEVLIHHHATGQWLATGPHLPRLLAPSPNTPQPPVPHPVHADPTHATCARGQ